MSNGQMPMINVGGGLPPEILQQQQALNRQQKMAELLMQQGQSMPSGQMVSGRYVAPSFFQYAAPLFQTYAGKSLAEKAEKEQLALAEKLRGEQTRLGKEYLGAMQGKEAVYEPNIPTETYETVQGKMISPATGPNYQRAFEIANDPLAPAWAKAQAMELMKPRVFKEGETFSVPSFTGGEVKFNQMGGGGVNLPSDVKSAAVRVGLDPSKANTWGQNELNLINNRIVADKEAGRTNLVVNTGKAYTGAFGEGIAKEDLGKYSIAEKAPAIYQNALNTEQLLNKGAITGLGAEYKLNLARAFNVAGANNNEIIKNTEQLVANRGQIVLDSIKASGLGAGQGFTDKDRQFLEKVKGGTIELNSNTLRELARIEKSVAQSAIDAWNKRLPNIPKEAIQGTGIGPIQLQSGGRVVDFNSLPK
jgi:hypothetical protein